MSDQEKEKRLIVAIEDALSAQGAWMAHCYGFQYLKEYYTPLLALAKKLKVSTKWLEKVYRDVTDEYRAVSENEGRSFMNEEDEYKVSILDCFFVEALAGVCKNISDKALV